jgi:hypothetical protein
VALKIVFFVLWIPIAVVAALLVFRRARRETGVLSVAVLAGAVALAALVVYPRTFKDTASAAHRYRSHQKAQSSRPGGPQDCLTANFHACVRERVWGELRNLIPPHDRFYVETDYGLIRFWTFTSLLPRIAVQNPRDAQWVIVYRANPDKLGVTLSKRILIRHVYANGKYSLLVGKVAP